MTLGAREILIYFAIKYQGDWNSIYKAITTKEKIEDEEAMEVINNLKCKAIALLDEDYPKQLKEIYRPPFVLFCDGDTSLLKGYNKNISVVGARDPSDYAITNLKKIIKDIALDYTVVSGCALGIDALAQQACIDNGGRTIGVLGSGIDVIHPKTNTNLIKDIAKNHLLISEYPPGVEPTKENFPARNRIVVGLSLNVLAFDIKERSGTHSSTTLALQSNRNLLTIPYPIGTEYLNNEFIKDGCYLVESGDDIRFLIDNF